LEELSNDAEGHIFTRYTDSGLDIKRAVEKVMPTMCEWWISHSTYL